MPCRKAERPEGPRGRAPGPDLRLPESDGQERRV